MNPEDIADIDGELHGQWRYLRGSMRDLVAFGSLRALWSGQETATIVESFADALLSLVHAEIVLVRLRLTSDDRALEVVRAAAGQPSPRQVRQAARRLAPLLTPANVGSPLRIASPLGRGSLFLTVVPLGLETEYGFVAAGSAAAGFPDDLQRAMLGIATSQVSVALKERELFELASRKRAEEAKRASEVRFRAVFEGALDAMLIASDDGRCIEVNPAGCELLGRAREELVGRPLASACELEPENAWDVLRLRGRAAGEWRIRRPDGTIREVEYTGTANFLPGLHLAVLRDITERKVSEAERERRSRQLQGLADAALEIGAATSVARIAEIVTEAARRLIGAHVAFTSIRTGEEWTRPASARSLSAEYAAHGDGAVKYPPRGLQRLVGEANRPLRQAHQLAVPLAGRDGGNLGSIVLADKQGGDFDQADEAILVQLGQLAGEAAENARLLEEVTVARERLEALSRRLVDLQERERYSIARELHDEVGQILTGLNLMLETRRRGAQLDLSAIKDLVGQLQERVRDLSLNLRPPMLDDLGLVPALLWHIERYRSQTGIHVRFHHRGISSRLPAGTEIAAYRVVQEALTNVARHAGVEEASVELWARSRVLELRVEDGGRGFDPGALPGASSGLTGMRERALLAGGTLAIESRPGSGTRLLARLPMAAPHDS